MIVKQTEKNYLVSLNLSGFNKHLIKFNFDKSKTRNDFFLKSKFNVPFEFVKSRFEIYLSCYIETTSEASLECKTMPLGKGISSGIFSFIRNREMKASIVALCILFILLVIAHIILYIVQRINVKNNAIPV